MEHPGRNWNRIECWCNHYLAKLLPSQALRWLWVLAHTAVGGYILLSTLVGSLGYIICLGWPIYEFCQEKVYEADPAVINPAHEGRLVSLTGQLSTTEWVTDPLTGVQARTPWLRRSTSSPLPRTAAAEKFDDETFYANEWQLGAYRISHYKPDYVYSSMLLPSDQLQFSQPAEGYQVTPPQPGESSSVLLTTTQGEPLCLISYCSDSAPLYIVARQCGNQLLMNDPAAKISLYPTDNKITGHFWEFAVLLTMGSVAHFIMLCLAFSCLRSALWHATGGKDLFRLPLCRASVLVVGICCCLYCGIFLVSGDHALMSFHHTPSHHAIAPGVLFLLGGLGLLHLLWKQWRKAAPAVR
jgi:hypothetical protein